MSTHQLITRTAAGLWIGLTTLHAGAQTTAPENAPTAMRAAAPGFAATGGAAIYATACQGCHMPEGKGAAGAGAYPTLAGNARLASSPYIVTTVLHGRRGMPPLGALLNDEQVAQVAAYIRTNFGNRYREPVAAADVNAARAR